MMRRPDYNKGFIYIKRAAFMLNACMMNRKVSVLKAFELAE